MAVLNSWQRVDRVIPGQPWGDGKDGTATISSDPNTRATYTGTADSTSGTAGSTSFANGDLVKMIQTQGTGAGQWEYNMVASGGGTTSLVMKEVNHYTYGTGAQIIKVPRYTTATVSAHSVTGWNGTTGGVEVILAKTSITVSGVLNGSALGFQTTGAGAYFTKYQGQGTGASTNYDTHLANGNGGGGGSGDVTGGGGSGAGGGGGGNASAGGTGQKTGGEDRPAGIGGGVVGKTDLTNMCMGGAGGSGGGINSPSGWHAGVSGGHGGAVIVLVSKSVVQSSTTTVNGAAGQNKITYSDCYSGAGGGGSAGSILIVCGTATLGTGLFTATAGAGGSSGYGGNGSAGRIAVHHSGTVTGTTSPTFTGVEDPTLIEKTGAFFAFL